MTVNSGEEWRMLEEDREREGARKGSYRHIQGADDSPTWI